MNEQQRQAKIKKALEKDGWLVIKLIKTTMNGITDLMALKNGVTKFIEVKCPEGVVSPLQHERHRQLREQGFEVLIWTDYEVRY